MTDAEDWQPRSKAMGEAIETVLREHAEHDSDRRVLGWVLVAEQVGADGQSYVRLMHDVDSTQWRRLGLLDYALTVQRGVIAHDED